MKPADQSKFVKMAFFQTYTHISFQASREDTVGVVHFFLKWLSAAITQYIEFTNIIFQK